MNATPEIREKFLEEITNAIVLLFREYKTASNNKSLAIMGYVTGLMKALEVIGIIKQGHDETVLNGILETVTRVSTIGFEIQPKAVQTIIDVAIKKDKGSET